MVLAGEMKLCVSCVAVHTNRADGRFNFEEVPLMAIIRTRCSD